MKNEIKPEPPKPVVVRPRGGARVQTHVRAGLTIKQKVTEN
jgi:hypothetical protein